jgi:hypothetical protein
VILVTIPIPPVTEEEQRALNGTPNVPYCTEICRCFERGYSEAGDAFCTATTPRTETAWTGKCICPQRKNISR